MPLALDPSQLSNDPEDIRLPGFDPDRRGDLDALYRAVEWSRWRLQPFREKQLEVWKEFVGAWYSETGANDKVPLNLIHLTHNIYLRQLVSKSPRATCTSRNPQVKPISTEMEAWMNRASEGMRLDEVLRMWVSSALFGVGCIKCGEAQVGEMQMLDGTRMPVGQPFAEIVAEDDRVHDMTAKVWSQVQFAGNRYRVSLEDAANNPLFDPEARRRLSEMTVMAYNERGDLRVTTLSQSTQQWLDEYRPHCELWDLWLPKEKLIITVAYENSVQGGLPGGVPLRVMEWKGPREGPYHYLWYTNVINNCMPVGPLMILMDMHLATNRAWRKLIRQIDRQKTWYGIRGAATADGERAVNVSDGEAVRLDNPDAVKVFEFPGAYQENLVSVEQLRNVYSWQAGNLDVQGGLSPQSQTLGQDELLQRSSSAQMADMQDQTTRAIRRLYRDLGYWWWTNPTLTYEATVDVEGVNVPVQISPEMRKIPFDQLDIDIEPYSYQHQTPASRLQTGMQFLQGVLMPNQPQMGQQGVSLKWPAIVDWFTALSDNPDIMGWLNIGPPPSQQPGMNMAQGALQDAQENQHMPPVTTRRNVRINRPSMTNQGMSNVMQLMARGGGSPQQAGQMGRQVA